MTNTIDRINDLRQRVRLGDDLSKEEMVEAVQLLRGARETTNEKSNKPSAVPMNLGDLFKEDADGKA